jgi:uncharacterized damage-inducible protein DinB
VQYLAHEHGLKTRATKSRMPDSHQTCDIDRATIALCERLRALPPNRSLIDAIDAEVRLDLEAGATAPPRLLVMPGAFHVEYPHTGADGKRVFELAAELGWPVEKVAVPSLAPMAANAAALVEHLEQVPAGKYDWKPHDRSMVFGYLADMVATIPNWIAMEVNMNELDIAPADGSTMKREPNTTAEALVSAFDKAAAEARAALQGATEDHLLATWHLKARGKVVQSAPRHEMISDTINHWVHHRGQMTVYLRLLGAKIPSLYGPSADENPFA